MIETASRYRRSGPFVEEVIKKVGNKKLVRRSWREGGVTIMAKHYLEEAKPGRPSCVTRHWFNSEQAAARALDAAGSASGGERPYWFIEPSSTDWRL